MKKYLKGIIVSLLLVVTLVVSTTSMQPVSAVGNCPGKQIETSTDLTGRGTLNSKKTYCNNPDGTGENGVIMQFLIGLLKFFTFGVGIAVAGGIITGGIVYGTARGNSSQTQKGVMIIVNSVIGLLLYIFMFAILNFLIPGGIFT